jgi:hypothetical protein
MKPNAHQHTVLALFIVIIVLRLYQNNKLGKFWDALNGNKATVPAATPTTKQPVVAPTSTPVKP